MEKIVQLPRDINKFCRTCMSFTENERGSFKNHVVQNNQLTELSKILQSLTSLKVAPNDGLPQTLCCSCTEQLKLAYEFKNQCISASASLLKLMDISKSNDDTEEASDSLQLPSETNDTKFNCEICKECFATYYDLSKHMIKHNSDRSLLERFLDSRNENIMDYKLDDCKLHENLIKERKEYTSNALQNKIFNSDNSAQENSSKTHMDFSTIRNPANNIIKETSKKISKITVCIRCKICTQEFTSRKELISHLCRPLNDTIDCTKNTLPTTCSLCKQEFSDTSLLSLHFLKHTFASENASSVDAEFFFCEICGQTFETSITLNKHYNEQHDGKPAWPCSKCSEVYEEEQELLRHDSVAHQSEEIKPENCISEQLLCVLCYQQYASKPELLVHSRTHLMKKYACKKCSLSFCTKQSYFAHLKSHPGYQYTCPTCGKHLSTKSALKSHIVGVHSVELCHTCATCGKSFATQGRLKTHSLIHSSHKKYVCSYCGYQAHKIGDLQIHTRTHTSERPYKCTFAKCTMSFKTSSHLCDHVRRHLQIRKFQCSTCSMGFTTNHGLKIHQMQHTGEKPHTCIVCNQKFRRKYHVKVHMKQHNPEYA